jgi:uncharacterized protein YdcH (DUF465 family)
LIREKELREIMLRESEEFKKLHRQHQKFDKELDKFKGKSFLTENEKLKEKELKKRKLALKDRMYFLMREYRRSH